MNSRIRKILTFAIVIVLLFVLTACTSSKTAQLPIVTEWGKAKFFDYILVIPVGFIMQFFAGIFGNNFAAGIIITTIIIRTLAWPIYAKSNDMSIKMQLMQPDLQRLQAKYEGREDPQSKQRMQIETANLYKKHGVNPLGCLMPFLQMPIFIAVYQTVIRIVHEGGIWTNKVSNKNFLGIDLSGAGDFKFLKEGFATKGWHGVILAIVVFGTNILLTYLSSRKPKYLKETHKHNPQSKETEQQQKMMQMMPYIFGVMMFGIALTSNSLALYWIVGNIYSIVQTSINRKINEKKYYKLKNKDLVVNTK